MHSFARNNSFLVHQRTGRRHKAAIIFSRIALGLMLALGGCGGSDNSDNVYKFYDPSTEPIKATLKTTIPISYAASVAMASVSGSKPSNVTYLSNTCTAYPCGTMLTITDDDSAWPLKLGTYGTIIVLGEWTSAEDAILTVSFLNDAGSRNFPVHDVSLVPVSRSTNYSKGTNGLRIVYTNIDMNVSGGPVDPRTSSSDRITSAFLKSNVTYSTTDPSVNVNVDAWVIETDNKGTANDPTDDTYSISGGGEYIMTSSGSESILQLGLVDETMGPGCSLNPVAGLSAMNELAVSSSNLVLATALIGHEPSVCDGKAKVLLATGNYLMSIGKSIPLNLTSP